MMATILVRSADDDYLKVKLPAVFSISNYLPSQSTNHLDLGVDFLTKNTLLIVSVSNMSSNEDQCIVYRKKTS
jgi:hypothetical protein